MKNCYGDLVELVKSANEPLDIEELGIHSLLHHFQLNEDFEGAKDFSNSLACFYYRVYEGYLSFGGAFLDSREDLDKYAYEADCLLGSGGKIEEFYRRAVDYIDETKVDLN